MIHEVPDSPGWRDPGRSFNQFSLLLSWTALEHPRQRRLDPILKSFRERCSKIGIAKILCQLQSIDRSCLERWVGSPAAEPGEELCRLALLALSAERRRGSLRAGEF